MHEIKTTDGHIFQIAEKMKFGLLRRVQKMNLKYIKMTHADKAQELANQGAEESEIVRTLEKTVGMDMDLSGTVEAEEYYIVELIQSVITPDDKTVTSKSQIREIYEDLDSVDGFKIVEYCKGVYNSARTSSTSLQKKT